MTTLWTIGYERALPDDLVAELQAAGVQRVIDVRQRAQSRRPGMSKTRLSQRLAADGIAYEHRRTLGTPPEIRPFYRRGAVREAGRRFREHAETHAADELDALAAELEAGGPPTALLCLEAEASACHRRVVAELLQARLPGLLVVDL
ncbi:MAG TPA: DUF488 domain-containing protein [Conexibacter sp.]|jgi:uncharacterized protein (DUF488 family)